MVVKLDQLVRGPVGRLVVVVGRLMFGAAFGRDEDVSERLLQVLLGRVVPAAAAAAAAVADGACVGNETATTTAAAALPERVVGATLVCVCLCFYRCFCFYSCFCQLCLCCGCFSVACVACVNRRATKAMAVSKAMAVDALHSMGHRRAADGRHRCRTVFCVFYC